MAVAYYEGTKIHKVGFPFIVTVSWDVAAVHASVVEWFLFVAPVRGRAEKWRMDRLVHRADQAAPPVEPGVPVIDQEALRETAMANARLVLTKIQGKVHKKYGDEAVLAEATFSEKTHRMLVQLWLRRVGTEAIIAFKDYTRNPEFKDVLRRIIAMPQSFSSEFPT